MWIHQPESAQQSWLCTCPTWQLQKFCWSTISKLTLRGARPR